MRTKPELFELEFLSKRNPGGPETRELVEAYLELGRPEDAIGVCKRWLMEEHDSVEGLLAKARSHMALWEWREAQAELLNLVKLDRNSRPGFRLLGETLLRRMDFERARPILEHAESLEPGDLYVRHLRTLAQSNTPLGPPTPKPSRVEAQESDPPGAQRRVWRKSKGSVMVATSALPRRVTATSDGRRTDRRLDTAEPRPTGKVDTLIDRLVDEEMAVMLAEKPTMYERASKDDASHSAARLSSSERERILRVLRDDGGRTDEGDHQVVIGTSQEYDFDFDGPPVTRRGTPPAALADVEWDLDDEPAPANAEPAPAAQPEPELLPDHEYTEELGEYEIFEMLDEGGYGRVFRAVQHSELGGKPRKVTVALKRMQRHLAADAQQIERFRNEAFIVERLTHPNIARLVDLQQREQEWLIAYEFVNGYDVKTLLELSREASIAIPPQLAVHIVASVAAALDHGYTALQDDGSEARIVHRDVSPSNVLLSLDGAVKLTDFGLAYSQRDTSERGNLAGKYRYMSPEMARGEQVDHRHDIFSAGVVLFELLEGRPLFSGERTEILRRLRTQSFETVCTRPVSPALQVILRKATAPEREQRFPSAGDLEAALRDVEQGERWQRSPRALRSFLADHRRSLQDLVQRKRARRAEAPISPARLAAGSPVETSLSREVRDRLGDSISNVRAREWIAQGIRAGGEANRTSNVVQSRTRRLDAAKNLVNGLYTTLTNRLLAAFTPEERAKWVARRAELGIDVKPSAERKMDELLREARLPSLSFIAGWLGTKQAPKPPELAERVRSALGIMRENREVLGAIGETRNVLAHLVEYEQGNQPLGGASRYITRVVRDGAPVIEISPTALALLEDEVRVLMRRHT